MPRVTHRPQRSTARTRASKPHPKPKAKAGAPPLPMPDELIKATTTADVVTVPARSVLALDGQGAPEGEAFPRALMAVYGMGYTLKFTRKKAGPGDFKIGPLEARWWADDRSRPFPATPREEWRWQLRLGVPDDVTAVELMGTVETVTRKKGGKLEGNPELARVKLTVLPATRYGRVLHIGPYANESESFARILEALKAAGLSPGTAHSEVYLSDPRRTQPEKLKTVLLLELA